MAVRDLDPSLARPEEVAEEEEACSQARGKFTVDKLIPPAFLFACSFVAGQFLKDKGFDVTSFFTPSRSGAVSASLSESDFPTNLTTREQVILIDNFLRVREYLENIFRIPTSVASGRFSEDKASIEFIEGQSKRLVLDGVVLSAVVLPVEQNMRIYERGDGNVVIDGEAFDLESPFERSIAAAILELKMRKVKTEFEFAQEEETFLAKERAQLISNVDPSYLDFIRSENRLKQETQEKFIAETVSNIELLPWLKRRGLDVEVERGSWGIVSSSHILRLAKSAKILDDRGFPMPLHFRFVKDGGKFGGWYQGHNHLTSPFTVVVANNGGVDTGSHELGHFISDAHNLQGWREKMSPFSQEAFTKFVYGDKVDPRDKKEEYANGINDFLFEGQGSRQRYSVPGPLKEIMRKTYEFFRNMFGDEFRDRGEPIKYIKEYKPGVLVSINDPDSVTPGFLLRQDAEARRHVLDPGFPAVFHNDSVELLERRIVQETLNSEVVMWRVRVVRQEQASYAKVGNIYGAEGWVEEKALGFNVDSLGRVN